MEQAPVLDIILMDMRWTLLLVGTSTLFTMLLGMVMGAFSAYRRGGTFDLVSTGSVCSSTACPYSGSHSSCRSPSTPIRPG